MHRIVKGKPGLNDKSDRQQQTHVIEQWHIGMVVKRLVQEKDGKEGSHHQKCKQHIPALAECHIQGKITDQLKQKDQSVLDQSKKTNLLRILLQQQIKGKNRICKDNGDDAVFG